VPFRISLPPASIVNIASTTALPAATVGVPYSFQLTAKGGTPPYRWTAVKPFPTGLTLSSAGTITGKPQKQGGFRATLEAADSAGNSVNRTFGIFISDPAPTNVRAGARRLLKSAGQDVCSQIPAETDFAPSDPRAVLAAALEAPKGVFIVEWLNPRGEVARMIRFDKSSDGPECLVDALPVAGQRAASDLGDWRVRLLWGYSAEVFTLKFHIGDKTPAAPARTGRAALLIGNSAYQKLPRAGPASSDLDPIENALREDGFEAVRKANVTLVDLREAVRSFSSTLHAGDTVLVYYSGWDIPSGGDDWLLPVNFDPGDPRPLSSKAYSVLRLQQLLEDQKAKLKFIMLDVSRQGAGKGLEAARADDSTAMVYAAPPGAAPKAGASSSGAFARALAEVLRKPGVNAKDALQNELPKAMARADSSSPPPLAILGGGADFVFCLAAASDKRE